MQKINNKVIQACKKGNRLAQLQVYDAYCDAMFTIACRYLPNENDAKDAMQEGFLKAFMNIDRFNPTATLGAWLKRIIINQCLDVIKARKIPISDQDVESLAIIEEDNWHFETSISKQGIVEAIQQLTLKYKLVVTLYLIEGYDHVEISQILNIPVKTSRTQLSRGKLKLRSILKNKHHETGY
jgi:RNA polymerase sigma-70 factor (ECF subfamily)